MKVMKDNDMRKRCNLREDQLALADEIKSAQI